MPTCCKSADSGWQWGICHQPAAFFFDAGDPGQTDDSDLQCVTSLNAVPSFVQAKQEA